MTAHITNAISPQAALIYTMVLVAAADSEMPDRELHRIGTIVQTWPAFQGFDAKRLTDTARECAVILQTANGLERVLSVIKANLPAHLLETAYFMACDIALNDGRLPFEEMRILQKLRQNLGLDRLVAGALERAVSARHARA
jgi:tellurite resistance protein